MVDTDCVISQIMKRWPIKPGAETNMLTSMVLADLTLSGQVETRASKVGLLFRYIQ